MWFLPTVHYRHNVWYLTDRQLFDEQRLEGVLPKHLWLTHDGVRTVFNIPKTEDDGKTYWRFYDRTTLPPDLENLFPSFDAFLSGWNRIWHELVPKSQLRSLVLDAPPPWSDEAWEELLLRNHIESCLTWIIIGASNADMQLRAWQALKERAVTIRDTHFLAHDMRVSEVVRREAAALYNSKPA